METRRKMKLGTSDKIILGVGYTLLGLFVLAVFVPLVYVVLASFMDPNVLNNQGLSFNFKDWTLDAYRRVLENDMIWRGFANSFFYSAAFTVISVFVTLLAAYPMSKKEFVGRKFFNIIFVITMFFGGGLVPSYLNIQMLGMRDTIWAMILPGAISAYNVVVFRTFFKGIPDSLAESATIDGAGHFRVLFSIILPLSKALLATFTLFSVVGYWNDYMSALLYLDSESKFPIQLFLRKILNSMRMDDIADYSLLTQLQRVNTSTVQNAAIIITIVPILCVYPFLQKHFAKGVLIGSVKG